MTKVPSTLEMDGIYTEDDVANHFFVMKPCVDCGKYTKQDTRNNDKPCMYCGGAMGIASNYWASLRTYRPNRKITAADRKKMGAQWLVVRLYVKQIACLVCLYATEVQRWDTTPALRATPYCQLKNSNVATLDQEDT